MATANLQAIEKRTVSVDKYLNELTWSFKEKFLERKQTYQLNKKTVRKLKSYTKDIVIVVFSAEWCKDSAANVPVLALIVEKLA